MSSGQAREFPAPRHLNRWLNRADWGDNGGVSGVGELEKTGVPSCVIADDHPAIRAGLRLRIETERVAEVLAEARSGDEALDTVVALKPDIALIDLRMPGMDGLQVLRELRARKSRTRVILVTAASERHLLEQAMAEGACGYVSKDSPLETLMQAVRSVHAGGVYVDPGLVHS